ncbi:hypothetical protein FPQ18DRAFT_6008 [Pyronema domesticum]|nr:hypothetical protein FPQ18DRAFT_6008 [Pyronema domesticum]
MDEDSGPEFSESDAESEEPWGGDGDDEEENTEGYHQCIHCQLNEDQDPSPDYEDPLECAVCAAFSHKQCDRDANDSGGVKSAFDEETSVWRCPNCAASGLAAGSAEATELRRARINHRSKQDKSASRLRKRKADDMDIDDIDEEDGPISTRRGKRRDRDRQSNGRAEPEDDEVADEDMENEEMVDEEMADGDGDEEGDEEAETDQEGDEEDEEGVGEDEDGDEEVEAEEAEDKDDKDVGNETHEEKDQPHDKYREPSPSENMATTNGRQKKFKRDVNISVTKKPGEPGQRQMILHIGGLDKAKLAAILSKPPNPAPVPKSARRQQQKRGSSTAPTRRRIAAAAAEPTALDAATILLPVPATPEDEANKPYGGILSEADANTTATLPGPSERERFQKAKKMVEQEQKMRTEIITTMSHPANQSRKEKESKKTGTASLIECIHFGEYEIDTWYSSPYPEEYNMNKVLWICEFCLKYMNSEYVCWRHKMKCPVKHPPGDEIYRDGSVSVFEIDGRKQPAYCQNLCLMAKLFLGSKTLYYDVHPFLFYVMTERDEHGMHMVGYFSKEKRSGSNYNVSCIITLPIHQRKGYGNLLIDFSYLLTRVEKRTGTPEKPFSDLGLVSYRNYWKLKLCYELRKQVDPLTIGDISDRTGMLPDDIICTLEALSALVRDPVTGLYALRLDYALFESHIERWEAKGYIKLNPKALVWNPYLMGHAQAESLNDNPVSTIAPRDEPTPIAKPKKPVEVEPAKKPEQPEQAANANPLENAENAASLLTETPAAPADPSELLIPESPVDPDAMVIDPILTAGLEDSIDPALINAPPPMVPPPPRSPTPIPPSPAKDDAAEKAAQEAARIAAQQAIIAEIRSIPPTRFEIVPALPGARRDRNASRNHGKRGRPRLASPSVRDKVSKARPHREREPPRTERRSRAKVTDLVESDLLPVPKTAPQPNRNRRIVTKAPRMQSLTAEVRGGSVSDSRDSGSRSNKGKGKGKAESVASVNGDGDSDAGSLV